jgi:hypothetical protein
VLVLPFVNGFVDRHGRVRYYFRRRGHRNVRLPGLPGSPEFMRAYEAAIGNAEPIVIGASRSRVGTVAAVVGMYLASAAFAGLADETRRTRRNILERFREAHGDKRIAAIERKHVQALIDAKAATPSAARNLLAVIRLLMQFAIDAGIRADDPTIGVTRAKIKGDGYATWAEHHIAAFEVRHPIGTTARLALALLLGTGQRRGDVVRMGRQHVISASDARRPGSRSGYLHTGFARRYAGAWRKRDARCMRSPRFPGIGRCASCSAIPMPWIKCISRARQSNASGTIGLQTARNRSTNRVRGAKVVATVRL